MTHFNNELPLKEMANAIRALTMDVVEKAKSGHPGMPMGMADVATVLFSKFLKFNPAAPDWPDRDRFILSAGHGCMLLYSLLYLTGYEDMTLDEIKNFRQWGSRAAGHPEYGMAGGIEATTGPLGQGLGNAVGMALVESLLRAHGGYDANHHTYVIVGDGCLMEGISQEAISFAGHLKLSKLVVLFDDNGITIDGKTSLATSENHIARFQACSWNTYQIDGHNYDEIEAALQAAQTSDKPVLIACKTIIGYGSPARQGTSAAHGAPLGVDEIINTRRQLGWTSEPFVIPDLILKAWRDVGDRHKETHAKWVQKNYNWNNEESFRKETSTLVPKALEKFYEDVKKNVISEATRKSSEYVLSWIFPRANLLGGSADLTPSNNTFVEGMTSIIPDDHEGHYIHYGIREHAMGSIMNGIALHKHFQPYGGTFLAFSDYCRPAIRLSAMMKLPVIYVMTHDSIGLGEDGPTHQPIEQLTGLRAIPNLNVFRPADAIETAECWMLAVFSRNVPSLLALSRQNVPLVRLGNESPHNNKSAKGGYILKKETNQEPDITLIATGSEVHVALQVQELLGHDKCRVVSMPCTRLFDLQPLSYQEETLGRGYRICIEAGATCGWYKYTQGKGFVIGIDNFGESAPAERLFHEFGFNPQAIFNRINDYMASQEMHNTAKGTI